MLARLGITRVLRDLAVFTAVSSDAKTFVDILVTQSNQVTLTVPLVVASTVVEARLQGTGVRQVLGYRRKNTI